MYLHVATVIAACIICIVMFGSRGTCTYIGKPAPEQVMIKEGGQMAEGNFSGAQLTRKEATQRCGAYGRLGALGPLELRLIKSIAKVLCQCLSLGRY